MNSEFGLPHFSLRFVVRYRWEMYSGETNLDTFPMVTDELLESKVSAEDWSELVADSFELTLSTLQKALLLTEQTTDIGD